MLQYLWDTIWDGSIHPYTRKLQPHTDASLQAEVLSLWAWAAYSFAANCAQLNIWQVYDPGTIFKE